LTKTLIVKRDRLAGVEIKEAKWKVEKRRNNENREHLPKSA
jgi:hypothetical protein